MTGCHLDFDMKLWSFLRGEVLRGFNFKQCPESGSFRLAANFEDFEAGFSLLRRSFQLHTASRFIRALLEVVLCPYNSLPPMLLHFPPTPIRTCE